MFAVGVIGFRRCVVFGAVEAGIRVVALIWLRWLDFPGVIHYIL